MIGGNTNLIIKELNGENESFDENGARIVEYKQVASLFGWLDLMTGDSKYDYKAKIEDSTHIFICDYIDVSNVDVEKSKASINGEEYDLKYIDDPMGLNEQLEIYLKKVGGQ